MRNRKEMESFNANSGHQRKQPGIIAFPLGRRWADFALPVCYGDPEATALTVLVPGTQVESSRAEAATMGDVFHPLDLVIFFAALIGVMVVGLIAGRKEETSEDYFLAGRGIPWWGVAGSIFGTNVSANHMVGMLGVGFGIGFAQSHFELGAIAGLMLLCYGFLPVYRKLQVYTLSEYLGRRYDERSRLMYAIIMVVIMAFVQMVPGLYVGARAICVLVGGRAVEQVTERAPLQTGGDTRAGVASGSAVTETKVAINRNYYSFFVIGLAAVAAAYTVFGGLKAVIWTDVIQSTLLLAAGITVAVLTFYKIGGWGEMMAIDRAQAHKMTLYQPLNHPELPWTGVFTGLMALHFFYWGTNQFIVQRALSARSDREARLGIVAAGFLKLLIPFFAIAAGVAAFYLFKDAHPDWKVASDAAFPQLVREVIPSGFGLVGLIAAGLIGAILSSVDSMMNSAATIVTIDIYKRHFNPDASDRQLIRVGRLSIVVFVTAAALMAIYVLNPNSEKHFFLEIVDQQSFLTPGLLVAFALGMFWRRGTATAAVATIVGGVLFSFIVSAGYDRYVGVDPNVYAVIQGVKSIEEMKADDLPEEMQTMTLEEKKRHIEAIRQDVSPVVSYLGPKLNMFHRVFVVILLCTGLHVIVSLMGSPDTEKSKLVWTDLGGHQPNDLRNLLLAIVLSLGVFAVLGWGLARDSLSPAQAAWLGAGWTFAMFIRALVTRRRRGKMDHAAEMESESPATRSSILNDDRLWAGILCAAAVFLLFFYF